MAGESCNGTNCGTELKGGGGTAVGIALASIFILLGMVGAACRYIARQRLQKGGGLDAHAVDLTMPRTPQPGAGRAAAAPAAAGPAGREEAYVYATPSGDRGLPWGLLNEPERAGGSGE